MIDNTFIINLSIIKMKISNDKSNILKLSQIYDLKVFLDTKNTIWIIQKVFPYMKMHSRLYIL